MPPPLPSASTTPAPQGQDIGGPALAAYQKARAPRHPGRTVSVDLLNRSLLTDFLPVQALRGLGLHLLANVGPLRRLVMQGGLGAPGTCRASCSRVGRLSARLSP